MTTAPSIGRGPSRCLSSSGTVVNGSRWQVMVLGSEADIPSNLLPLRLLLIYRPKEEGKPGVSISKLIIIVRLMILLMGPYMLLLQ